MKIKRITIILVLVFFVSIFIIIKGYISSNILEAEIMNEDSVEEVSNLQEEKNNKIIGERSAYFI